MNDSPLSRAREERCAKFWLLNWGGVLAFWTAKEPMVGSAGRNRVRRGRLFSSSGPNAFHDQSARNGKREKRHKPPARPGTEMDGDGERPKCQCHAPRRFRLAR